MAPKAAPDATQAMVPAEEEGTHVIMVIHLVRIDTSFCR
jgi:hypothetical protein